jgi:hypothetical protein
MLLGHITDSAEVVLHEAIRADRIGIHRGAAGRPGGELVAFLGRRPLRGDSEGSAWSA